MQPISSFSTSRIDNSKEPPKKKVQSSTLYTPQPESLSSQAASSSSLSLEEQLAVMLGIKRPLQTETIETPRKPQSEILSSQAASSSSLSLEEQLATMLGIKRPSQTEPIETPRKLQSESLPSQAASSASSSSLPLEEQLTARPGMRTASQIEASRELKKKDIIQEEDVKSYKQTRDYFIKSGLTEEEAECFLHFFDDVVTNPKGNLEFNRLAPDIYANKPIGYQNTASMLACFTAEEQAAIKKFARVVSTDVFRHSTNKMSEAQCVALIQLLLLAHVEFFFKWCFKKSASTSVSSEQKGVSKSKNAEQKKEAAVFSRASSSSSSSSSSSDTDESLQQSYTKIFKESGAFTGKESMRVAKDLAQLMQSATTQALIKEVSSQIGKEGEMGLGLEVLSLGDSFSTINKTLFENLYPILSEQFKKKSEKQGFSSSKKSYILMAKLFITRNSKKLFG
ncbi:MAG: hypothetical protein JWO53_191 [Chlamydiia bacterium]|nr:hypothetical protein [Chlamydiia bacterium]